MSGAHHTHVRSTAIRDRGGACIWAAVASILMVTPAIAKESAPQPDMAALPNVDDVRGEPVMSGGAFGPARDFRILIEADHGMQSR
jgi:hypothetical protein